MNDERCLWQFKTVDGEEGNYDLEEPDFIEEPEGVLMDAYDIFDLPVDNEHVSLRDWPGK